MKRSKTENFQVITSILIENGIFFWIDQGTLLGYQRNGKLIEWDTDIDLSMWSDGFNKTKNILGSFQKKGYYCDLQEKKDAIYISDGAQHFIEIVRLNKRNGVVYRNNSQRNGFVGKYIKKIISLLPDFIHLRFKRIARSAVFGKKIIAKTPLKYFQEFKEVSFLNISPIYIPKKTIEYLVFKYGDDWENPNRDWDYQKNDGSILWAKKE